MAVTPGDGRSTAAKLQDLAAEISRELRDVRTGQVMSEDRARLAEERNADLVTMNRKLTEDRNQLREDVRCLREDNRKLANLARPVESTLRAHIEVLRGELAESRRINANLREKVRLAVDDGTAYKQALDVAQQGMRNLQAKLDDLPNWDVIQLQEKNTQLRHEYVELADKARGLKEEIESLRGMGDVFATNARLATRVQQLEERLADAQKSVSGEVVNRELVIEWREHERLLIAKYDEENEYGLAALHIVTRKILNKILTNEYPTR